MHSCVTSKNVKWCHLIWPTLYLVCVFVCTVLLVSISQVIGCEDHLDCVGWGVYVLPELCSFMQNWIFGIPRACLLLAGIKRSLFFSNILSSSHCSPVAGCKYLLCSVKMYTYFMRPFFHHQHLHPVWTAPSASPQLHIWFGLFIAVLTSFALITHQGVVTGQWVTLLFGWDSGWAFWRDQTVIWAVNFGLSPDPRLAQRNCY